MKRWTLILLLAGSLTACTVLPDRSPVALYTPALDFPVSTADGGAVQPWRLAVSQPAASGQLATPRILVHPTRNEVEVYPRAEWSEPAPVLIGNALIRAIEADGRVPMPGRSATGLEQDFELLTEVRDFQIELVNGPVAVARIRADLIAYPRGRIVASRVFQSRVAADSQQVGDAVAALSRTLDEVLPEIAAWAVEHGSGEWREHPWRKRTRRNPGD